MALNIAFTILLKTNINDKLLSYSDQILNFFVKNCEGIYGSKYNSQNIHGLTHISTYYNRFSFITFRMLRNS